MLSFQTAATAISYFYEIGTKLTNFNAIPSQAYIQNILDKVTETIIIPNLVWNNYDIRENLKKRSGVQFLIDNLTFQLAKDCIPTHFEIIGYFQQVACIQLFDENVGKWKDSIRNKKPEEVSEFEHPEGVPPRHYWWVNPTHDLNCYETSWQPTAPIPSTSNV